MSSDIIFVITLIVAAAIGLLINYFIAREFENAAIDKGYSEKKYFWICFLLGLPGYLLVIALPDSSKNTNTTIGKLPNL